MIKRFHSFKFSLIGLAIAFAIYLVTLIFGLDIFEAFLGLLQKAEAYEVDQLLLGLIPISIGFAIDLARMSLVVSRERLKLETVRTTMRSVDHIVGNAHNQLQYFFRLAKKGGFLDQEQLDEFFGIIQKTHVELDEIRRLDKIIATELSPGMSVLKLKET